MKKIYTDNELKILTDEHDKKYHNNLNYDYNSEKITEDSNRHIERIFCRSHRWFSYLLDVNTVGGLK